MAEKNIKSRIVHKHDIEENWLKSSLVPLLGEVIIFDADSTYTYPRLKIGNGSDNVNDLPFVLDNLTSDDLGVYVQPQEPVNAIAGDIWIDTVNDPSYIPPTLPEITEEDNGKVLMVVNGRLQLVKLNMTVDANGVVSM